MKKLSIYLVMGTILSFCIPVFSDCSSDRCTTVSLTHIYPDTDGNVYIRTTGNPSYVTSCNPIGTSNWYLLEPNVVGKKEIFATLLHFYTSQETFDVVFDDNASGDCVVRYVVATAP